MFSETVERVREAGLELVELPVWYDVDDAATLRVLEAELLEGKRPGFADSDGYDAAHTRQFLRARLPARKSTRGEDVTTGEATSSKAAISGTGDVRV